MSGLSKMKKLILVILVVIMVAGVLSGCGDAFYDYRRNDRELSKTVMVRSETLVHINNTKSLYYDSNTKIVYIIVWTPYSGFMSPYYADNGLPYRYNVETNELVKIGE